MLLRRFLPVISVLLFLAVMSGLAILSIQGQDTSYAAQGALHGQNALIESPPLNCPDAPPVQQGVTFFDFCSPKYVGNIAGPFGSHIVLVGENLRGTPDMWMVTKGQSITDPQKLNNCIAHSSNSCSQLPAPTQMSEQRGMTLFSWIWRNSFPSIPGDYYIIAIVGKLLDANVQIIPTPISFTLLTSAAPCISLDDGNGTPTDCSSQSPVLSVRLPGTTMLTIHGSNWLLGWNQNPITETVQITSTCAPTQECNKNSLFDITIPSNKIDRNGGFTTKVALPTNVSGTYLVSATNHVPQVATPGASDFSTSNINTIAEGTLTFGESEDHITLSINVRLPTPSPTSTNQPVPSPSPTQTPFPGTFNTARFDLFTAFAAIPAFLGIIVFFVIWSWQRRTTKHSALPSGGPPAIIQAGQQSLMERSQTGHPTVPANTALIPYAPPHKNDIVGTGPLKRQSLEHEYPLAPLPLTIPKSRSAPKRLKLGFLNRNSKRKIQKAVEKWSAQGELDDVVAVASKVLVKNLEDWEFLTQTLTKASSSVSSADTQNLEQLAIIAIHHIREREGAQELLLHCSTALVYYTIRLPLTQLRSRHRAAIQFDMGFAYLRLAAIAPQTVSDLLQLALQHYAAALSTYEAAGMSDLRARTLAAIGDVNVVMSGLPGVEQIAYFSRALESYKNAQHVAPSPQQQEIQMRINMFNPRH